MTSTIWTASLHDRELRALARQFATKEIAPNMAQWELDGLVPRSLHERAAELDLLGVGYPERMGGSGGALRQVLALTEEIVLAGGSPGLCAALLGFHLTIPHLSELDEAGIQRWVEPVLHGRKICAFAVTEPVAGSDVAGILTQATLDGDEYVVNGSKTFITSATRADFFLVAAKTGPGRSMTLLLIDRDAPGLGVSSKFAKMGWLCSDTAEVVFEDVRVPIAQRVGSHEDGFPRLMRHFETERLFLAVQAQATAQRVTDLTLDWVRNRTTFGTPLSDKQVVRSAIAAMVTQTEIARAYNTQAIELAAPHDPSSRVRAAMAKNVSVAAADLCVDRAVQLHGGMGYMRENEVERHYRDNRLMPIGGGATELLDEIIAKAALA